MTMTTTAKKAKMKTVWSPVESLPAPSSIEEKLERHDYRLRVYVTFKSRIYYCNYNFLTKREASKQLQHWMNNICTKEIVVKRRVIKDGKPVCLSKNYPHEIDYRLLSAYELDFIRDEQPTWLQSFSKMYRSNGTLADRRRDMARSLDAQVARWKKKLHKQLETHHEERHREHIGPDGYYYYLGQDGEITKLGKAPRRTIQGNLR